jgi:hypothetical protein
MMGNHLPPPARVRVRVRVRLRSRKQPTRIDCFTMVNGQSTVVVVVVGNRRNHQISESEPKKMYDVRIHAVSISISIHVINLNIGVRLSYGQTVLNTIPLDEITRD